MNMLLRRAAFAGCMILAALRLTGCAQFAAVSEAAFMMSPDEEQQLGVKMQAEVAKQYHINNDPSINSYVQSLGQNLWTNSPKGEIPPHFHVIDDDAINAFAIPGGDVYVQTGAIRAAADEAELAGVIAHELGHVVRRHSARGVSRETGLSTIQQIALGSDAGQATTLVSSMLSQSLVLRYSRADESEADTIAVGTLDRAGYDPEGLTTFFATLKQKYGDQGSGPVATLFASHPPTTDRMTNVETLIKQLPTPPKKNRPKTALQQIQSRLPPPAPAAK